MKEEITPLVEQLADAVRALPRTEESERVRQCCVDLAMALALRRDSPRADVGVRGRGLGRCRPTWSSRRRATDTQAMTGL